MQIENTNVQDANESLFVDYLSKLVIPNFRDFTFDIDHYRSKYPEAAQQLVRDPSKYYVLIKKFLQRQEKDDNLKQKRSLKGERFSIKIEGNLGANFVTPRGLNSRMANQLVGLQGIITKMDICQNYLQRSEHYCKVTKSHEARNYPDSFNPQKDGELNMARSIKTTDEDANPLQFQYGISTFKDIQMVVIQQLPQMAPPGLLPMSVQVVLQNELVNSVKPGDRVQMIGIYKLIAGMATKEKGVFRPYFICLSVKSLNWVASSIKRPVKTDFPKNEIYELFSRSVAPSVWGHENLKKAVLLMLVGGVQKNLENGTHLRGDINLLMIGDPGTAKSQMLRWVLSTVDISVGTTGSGASGVGLTAAVVTDKLTGQRNLQAGAMVLADRGVVCIDQFDKMNQIDRVAVHEVMEQQTVTIAKAGLHCSLNARCSVIAAANPIYGQYQLEMPPTKNIGMPDSLLSRFDLIFIIKDTKTKQRDQQIAQKVCRNHRLAPQFNDFLNQYMDADDYVVNPIEQKKQDLDAIFEKNNVYKTQGKSQILTQQFFKKYIAHVKQNVVPQLSDEAVKLCATLWSMLRQKDITQRSDNKKDVRVLPVTIRTHQALIRLATAHAKLLMMQTVEVQNIIEAFKLFCECNHGAEDALLEDLSTILKDLNIDYEVGHNLARKVPEKKNKMVLGKQQQKKMQTQDQIRIKIEKMNFRQNEKQADQALRRMVNAEVIKITFTKDQLSMTYKKCIDMLRKKQGNQKSVQKQNLFQELKHVLKSKEMLDAILGSLEQDGKVFIQENKIFLP